MRPTEFDILQVFTEEMGKKGENRKHVRFNIDEEMVKKINSKFSSRISLEELKKLADKCLSNEWLEHTVLGAGQYGNLILTTTGFGVIRSRQRKLEMLAQRSFLKKTSDFIEDHKGLFIFLGAAIALAGLLVRIFTGAK